MFSPATNGDDNEARAPALGYTFVVSISVMLCLFAAVAAVTAIELASPLGQRPPTLSLTIGEQHQQSIYGDYSWRGVIADAFQLITGREPLKAQSRFSARLNLDTRLGPPSESSCQLLRIVPTKCPLSTEPEFICWWFDEQTIAAECPPLIGATEQTLEFNVPPGFYALAVKTWWNNVGGTQQLFSVAVQEPSP